MTEQLIETLRRAVEQLREHAKQEAKDFGPFGADVEWPETLADQVEIYRQHLERRRAGA